MIASPCEMNRLSKISIVSEITERNQKGFGPSTHDRNTKKGKEHLYVNFHLNNSFTLKYVLLPIFDYLRAIYLITSVLYSNLIA